MEKVSSRFQSKLILILILFVTYLVSVADLVFFFEQEIYSAMMRSNVNRLPRLWIDLPGGMEKAKEIQSKSLPFRIKASFGKKK